MMTDCDINSETIAAKCSLPIWICFDNNFVEQIEFTILRQPGWITSPLVYHHLHLQIRKVNVITGKRSPLENSDKCAIIDFPASSIFKQTEVYFNHNLVSNANSAQMYYHYLRAKLEFPDEVRRTFLAQVALWCPDTPGKFESFETDENEGYMLRHTPFLGGQTVELYAPLMQDIFRQSLSFPDDIDIRVRMELNNVRLCINGTPPKDHTYELGIIKSDLCVTRYRPTTRYRVGPSLAFPTKTVEAKHFVIPQGPGTIAVDIHDGAFPNQLTVLQLSQEAFNGAFEHNALNFLTNHIKQAQLVINNTITLPPIGYQLERMTHDDAADPNAVWFPVGYVKTYVECMTALAPQASLLEMQSCISHEAFAAGSFLLSWRLHYGPTTKRRNGLIRFVAELHQPIASPIVLLCLFHHDRTIVSRANGSVEFH